MTWSKTPPSANIVHRQVNGGDQLAWSDVELAYLAGLIDGEGTIHIRLRHNKNGRRYHAFVIHISNTEPSMIRWLKDHFGGGVGLHIYAHGNFRPLYRWAVDAKRAEAILLAVLPYLVTKREHAEIALELRATVGLGNNRVSQEVWDAREALTGRLHLLNKRGAA